MLAASGYLSQVDPQACIGCGDCADFCQFSALSLSDGHAVVDPTLCMGCGVCTNHCPQEALSLALAPWRGQPLEIQALMAAVQ